MRLARWLLAKSDGTKSNDLHVTHEVIASMLVVRSAGITCAALTLKEEELISYNRGTFKLLIGRVWRQSPASVTGRSKTNLSLWRVMLWGWLMPAL
jgi:hypothetical protein